MPEKLQKRIKLEDRRPYNTHHGDFKVVLVENDITFIVPSFLSTAKVLILMDSDWEVTILQGYREEEEEEEPY